MSDAARLARGIAALGLDLPEAAQQRLLAYLALLAKWNKVYNLTAVRNADQMLTHHLLDSLAVLPQLPAELGALADVGTGGGLPGIPLAIARPDCAITLIETSGKKATFLKQAKIELALGNVHVINARVEDVNPADCGERAPEAVISRAFSSLVDFVQLTDALVPQRGHWYAMKGVLPTEEMAALPAGVAVERAIELTVPELDAERHLIVLKRTH